MKHLLIVIMALFCLVANAQNQVVRRHGAKKEVGAVTSKKTTGTSSNRKKTIPAVKKQTQHRANISYNNGALTVGGVNYKFVRVEAGTFYMGATSEQQDPGDCEKPVHKVTLTRNYYIGKTEVTQALWKAVMGSNPSDFKGDNKPVENVSWNDCQTFISRLNAATGKNFRLPTEAEWEFAARGGNKSNHYQYSGSNNLRDVAWYYANSNSTTHDVAASSQTSLDSMT